MYKSGLALQQLILVNSVDLLASGLVVLGIGHVGAKLCCKVCLCLVGRSVVGSSLSVSLLSWG